MKMAHTSTKNTGNLRSCDLASSSTESYVARSIPSSSASLGTYSQHIGKISSSEATESRLKQTTSRVALFSARPHVDVCFENSLVSPHLVDEGFGVTSLVLWLLRGSLSLHARFFSRSPPLRQVLPQTSSISGFSG